MGLRKTKGNNYPWITHCHTHLGGECPHQCAYCYVNSRFGRPEKYQGPIRLIEKELAVPYRKNKVIFIENCNDLFADGVGYDMIEPILTHCCQWGDNEYVFQTKNPARYSDYWASFPYNFDLGVTIETNRDTSKFSKAPGPYDRFIGMLTDFVQANRSFVTIEPIMDFDLEVLPVWIKEIKPEFVNIGADSKGHGLPEPPFKKVQELINELKGAGIEVREKANLERLRK